MTSPPGQLGEIATPSQAPAGSGRLQATASQPVFVGSDIYRRAAYGSNHPLAIPRVGTVMDLCRVLGWLDDDVFRDSPRASAAQLAAFHDPAYIAALRRADETGQADRTVRERYGLGTMENPIFSGMYERAATSVGGSILAAELVLQGGVAYHPAGGTHHGRPNRASGFCYFNDPVFAILTLLNAGLARIYYVDLDAHFGDGVQDAFARDDRVLTLSIHEAGRWPHAGPLEDRAGGGARNLPVPRGFNDSELDHLMEKAVLPLGQRFAPDAVIVTCGADGLAGDPLSAMELSNLALWRAVETLTELSPRCVVLGGGGYNPWTVARCWAGLWGRLAGNDVVGPLPAAAQDLLRALESDLIDEDEIPEIWHKTLADRPNPGAVRGQVAALAPAVLSL
jgi:acetoin utilization protein AcuC